MGIAKGAGMIEPNMATMLVYILTDLQVLILLVSYVRLFCCGRCCHDCLCCCRCFGLGLNNIGLCLCLCPLWAAARVVAACFFSVFLL